MAKKTKTRGDALEKFMRELRAMFKAAGPLPMLLTQADAAAQLSIGLTKLNELIKSGRLKTVSLGEGKRGKPGHPMVPRSELERLARPDSPRETPPRPARRRASRPVAKGAKPATAADVEALLRRRGL